MKDTRNLPENINFMMTEKGTKVKLLQRLVLIELLNVQHMSLLQKITNGTRSKKQEENCTILN
jgi:hypothetical protein